METCRGLVAACDVLGMRLHKPAKIFEPLFVCHRHGKGTLLDRKVQETVLLNIVDPRAVAAAIDAGVGATG